MDLQVLKKPHLTLSFYLKINSLISNTCLRCFLIKSSGKNDDKAKLIFRIFRTFSNKSLPEEARDAPVRGGGGAVLKHRASEPNQTGNRNSRSFSSEEMKQKLTKIKADGSFQQLHQRNIRE